MTPATDTPRQAAPRARRAAAARALQDHPRRAQLAWDDLAAWPDWAALGDDARAALALRAGAWWHAGAWQHCINGPVLRTLQAALGPEGFARLLAAPSAGSAGSAGSEAGATGQASEAGAPPEDPATLAHTGLEALLASVASPLLRVVLREQFAPATLPPLPALDAARARRAVQQAESGAPPAQASAAGAPASSVATAATGVATAAAKTATAVPRTVTAAATPAASTPVLAAGRRAAP